MQKSTACTIFDPLSVSTISSFCVAVQSVVKVTDFGEHAIVVDSNQVAYKFKLEPPKKNAVVPLPPERLIDHVVDVQANRYCFFILTAEGRLWVMGKDTIKIGVLGLGNQNFSARTLQLIACEDPIAMISLTDSYSVALTAANDILIWGTTLDHFFGIVCSRRRKYQSNALYSYQNSAEQHI